MNEIRIYKSIWKGLKLLAGCLLFVVLGICMILHDPDSQWLGWLGTCFFGLGIPVGLFMVFDRRPSVIINEEGITIRNLKKIFLEWQHISEAAMMSTNKSQMICLYLKDGFSLNTGKVGFRKKMHQLNKNMGYGDAAIPVFNLKVNPERLLNLVVMLINAESPERKNLLIDQGVEGVV
jgi:hypothetical protein